MKKIPITLLTGFLGAGKSTLINRILAEKSDINFGLIVNEFGDVKLESQIIEASEEDLVELSNGCMCCVVRGDLIQTVQNLLKRKGNKIQHILIEASGLSDPVPIAQTFLADDLEGKIRFDSILCLADTMNFSTSLKDFAVAANQLKYSDFVIMTKTDLADAEGVQTVREAIAALAPKSLIYDVKREDLLDLVLDVTQTDHTDLKSLEYEDRSRLAPLEVREHKEASGGPRGKFKPVQKVHRIHEDVDTFFYKTTQPFDFKRVGKILDNLPPQVVRAKGFLFLNTPEAQFLKVVFQAVGRRHSLDAKPWGEKEERLSALVFIGKDLPKTALKQDLDSALG